MTVLKVGPSLLEVIVEAEKQKDASKYLLENYKGKFMVWSLLPVQDTEDFDNDVQVGKVCCTPLS